MRINEILIIVGGIDEINSFADFIHLVGEVSRFSAIKNIISSLFVKFFLLQHVSDTNKYLKKKQKLNAELWRTHVRHK